MLKSRYTGCVYLATNIVNGRAYIGKTIMPLARRRTTHEVSARAAARFVFHSALRKYGCDAFVWCKLYESDLEEALFDAERALIADFRADGVKLYNVGEGGEGQSVPCSEERKAKLRTTMKGRRKSEETKRKLSAAHKGKRKSASHIEKMRKSRIGMKLPSWTPERRAKIEETWRKRRELGLGHSEETRARQSESAKRRFERPGEREKVSLAGKKGAAVRWGKV